MCFSSGQTDRGEKPLKLRRLELDLHYKDSATGKQSSLDTFYDHFLWTLRKSPLYTLDITLREPFSTIFKGYTLPSVRGLRLSVDVDLPFQNKVSCSLATLAELRGLLIRRRFGANRRRTTSLCSVPSSACSRI